MQTLETLSTSQVVQLFRQIGLEGAARAFNTTPEELTSVLKNAGICVACNA